MSVHSGEAVVRSNSSEWPNLTQTGGLKPLGFCGLLLLSLAPHSFFPVRASARIILLAELQTFILRP
jgi:hypothetical protein